MTPRRDSTEGPESPCLTPPLCCIRIILRTQNNTQEIFLNKDSAELSTGHLFRTVTILSNCIRFVDQLLYRSQLYFTHCFVEVFYHYMMQIPSQKILSA